jgi:hypothetical protein
MYIISKIVSVNKIQKEAMAEPLSPEKAKEWAGRGQFEISDFSEEFPKGHTQRDYNTILEETGAGKLFGADIPKLRKFYMPALKNIVSIDGKEYFLVHVEKSKDTGRAPNKQHVDGYFQVFGPIIRKQNKNQTIDWDKTPRKPINFSYDKYADQVKRSPEVVKDKIDTINEFIADHNSFVEKEKNRSSRNITTLPLQIARAEKVIQKRLKDIEGIQESVEKPDAKGKAKTQQATEDLQALRGDIVGGKIKTSPANYAVAILETKFHSVTTLKELKQELTTLTPPFDPNTNEILLKYLNRVVDWQIQKREEEAAKKQIDITQKEERKESDLPEMKEFLLKNIKPIEKLPGQYDKTPGYFSPEGVDLQTHEIGETTSSDYEELSAILGSLNHARQTIIDLPTASNEYLLENGKARLNQILAFMENAKMFAKRYKEPVLVPSKEDPELIEINSKLFSKTSAGLGNALIAVILNQIIQSVTNEINRITAPSQPPVEVGGEKTLETTPESVREPVAKSKNLITRMAELLWIPFQDRMRLK